MHQDSAHSTESRLSEETMASAQKILKSSVLGWGSDLDPKNRPAFPKEANRQSVLETDPLRDYEKIESQVPRVKILVSTEHKRLPPVFGTSCPPKGLSGKIRELAFRFSEGQKSHWLLLIFADRVDVLENALLDALKGKPDNPFSEMGLKSEFRKGGFFSRFGHNRADMRRWRQQLLLLGSLAGGAYGFWRLSKRGRK
jgi:hypothetical protein